jgi:hypothetical protein
LNPLRVGTTDVEYDAGQPKTTMRIWINAPVDYPYNQLSINIARLSDQAILPQANTPPLAVVTKGQFFVDIPLSAFRGLQYDNFVMRVVATTITGQQVTTYTNSFVVKNIPPSADHLPAPNQAVVDYLRNTVLPTLNPVYAEDGKTIVEWRSATGDGDECKYWIQQTLVPSIFEESRPSIPNNNANAQYEWYDSSDDITKVASVLNLKDSPDPTKEVKALFTNHVLPGDFVQSQITYLSGDVGPHTFIIDEINNDGLWVFDSNWHLDKAIGRHFIKYSSIDDAKNKFTIYRINDNF